jgi:hypothetical protein
MRAKLLGISAVVGSLMLGALPLLAHHSFSAVFDQTQRVTLRGVVTKVEWSNPHTYFYLDVSGAGGRTVNWACETAGPNSLSRRGWKRNILKVGDHVTVRVFRAKGDSYVASASPVLLAGGREVFAGMAEDGGPRK